MIMYNNMSLFTTRCQNSNSKITQLQCCQVPLELALRVYLSFHCICFCFVYLFVCFLYNKVPYCTLAPAQQNRQLQILLSVMQ